MLQLSTTLDSNNNIILKTVNINNSNINNSNINSISNNNIIKKQCIIFLCGLIRDLSIIDKCADNLYDSIINKNKDFQFTLILNTSYEYTNTIKWDDKTVNYISKEVLEEKIKQKYKNIKIIYCDIPDIYIKENIWDKIIFYRLFNLFQNNIYLNYDLMIYLRPDVILNKQINLTNFLNGFYIVTGNIVRDCNFHNRDWDFIWMGNSSAFKIWCFIHFKRIYNVEIYDPIVNIFPLNINFSDKRSPDYIKLLQYKVGLIDNNYEYTDTHNIINYILENNYNVKVCDYTNLYGKIIR